MTRLQPSLLVLTTPRVEGGGKGRRKGGIQMCTGATSSTLFSPSYFFTPPYTGLAQGDFEMLYEKSVRMVAIIALIGKLNCCRSCGCEGWQGQRGAQTIPQEPPIRPAERQRQHHCLHYPTLHQPASHHQVCASSLLTSLDEDPSVLHRAKGCA